MAVAGAILLLAPCALVAQAGDWSTVHMLAAGAEVRVEAGGRRIRGRVRSIEDDQIVLRLGAREQPLPRAEVTRIDLKKRSHRGRNALIGLGVGAGVGIGIGVAASRCSGFGCIGSRAVEIGAPVGLAALGAAIGAVLPTGGWQEIYRAP